MRTTGNLLGTSAGELGYGLGTLRNSVFSEFTGKNQSHSCLDFTRGDSGLLGVRSEFRSFSGNAFKDVVDKRVQDGHRLVGDTSVRVNLLEDFVNIGRIGLLPSLSPLLLRLSITSRGRGLRGLLRSFASVGGGLCRSFGCGGRGCFASSRGRFGRHYGVIKEREGGG